MASAAAAVAAAPYGVSLNSSSAVKLESRPIPYGYRDWLLVSIDLAARKYCVNNDSVELALSTEKLAIGVSS